MSKTIQLKAIKKGFKVVKIKAEANERYVIVDETGKSFNKLKFVQSEKNLQIYAEVNGKEEQIVVLENYYKPNMNASVVGIDASGQEVGYIVNTTDGWSYMNVALPETELGFAFPLIGLGAAGAGIVVATVEGGVSSGAIADAANIKADTALAKITAYAQDSSNPANAPTVQDYKDAGIVGVDDANQVAISSALNTDAVNGAATDTTAEVQAIVDAYNAILAEANGATLDATPADPSAQQYASIGANIGNLPTDATNDVETLALLNDIIDYKNTADVDTVGEINNLARIANSIQLTATGATPGMALTEGDFTLIGLTGVTGTNLQTVLDAIAAKNDNGTETDSIAKLQQIINSTNVTPGQSVIDLGASGKLIAPVQVEGKWYYYWDRSGDGTSANAGSLNGGLDYISMDSLRTVFNLDINGQANPAGNVIDDTYRYALINGVLVGLPTANGGMALPVAYGSNAQGIVASGEGVSNNSIYDEMLAIWDAKNGSNSTAGTDGKPNSWSGGGFWTATSTSASSHVTFGFSNGQLNNDSDGAGYYVALEVVKTNAAPTLADTALSLGSIASNATAPANGNTTAGVLVSTLTGGITDTDAGATKGIAITGVHAGGTLYYSVDGGTTWTAATGISATNALLLAGDANTRIMYKDTTEATLTDAITFKAWDMTQHITEGVYANTIVMGGKSEFSTASDTVAITVTAPAVTPGDAQIDLGSSGKLIAPVQVEGKWYYYWDRSGNGSAEINGGDVGTLSTLLSTFNLDINGHANPAGNVIDDTYRYANINGVLVGLPTVNGGQALPQGAGVYQNGTTAEGYGTINNSQYDDFLAIWDSNNGSGTGVGNTLPQGQPTNWSASQYWTATQSTSGHYGATMSGLVQDITDGGSNLNFALEVVKLNAAPTLADTALSLGSIATNATAPANGNTTAGVLVSTLTGGITDTDAGATKGIAITSVHAGGTLYYSVDGGTTWTAATGISETNALLLAGDANTRIMYKDTTAATLTDAITFKAWDMTQHITEGVYANTTVMGGKSEFSTASDTVAVTVTAPVVTPGDAQIDLGTSGKLIAPVQVEGKWYYWWDMNGDGSWTADDMVTHDYLDGIFNHDVNGVANTTVANADGAYGTTNTYQYGTINGVQVVLPTLNGSNAMPGSGTYIPSANLGESANNVSTYDDMAAIYNSLVAPAGWPQTSFWTSTASATSHWTLNMGDFGRIYSTYEDTHTHFVLVQVASPNAAPTLVDTSLSLGSIASNATAPANGNTTAGVLVSTLTGGITDTDAGATKGIAITGVHAGGTLYYSVDGGTTWTAATGISATNALLLAGDANTRIMYKDTTEATLTDAITFKAWDMTQHITEGVYANTTVMGGKSEFSTASDTVAITVTAPVVTPGDAQIDLGTSGKLIAPVQVEGKWYYYWDRDGIAGSFGDDAVTMTTYASTFNLDINGQANPAGNVIDDTYRYAMINGVLVGLPTANGGQAIPQGLDQSQNGTAATTGGNSTYDDLLAIWDTHNGTETGTGTAGTPSGWVNTQYWTSTPVPNGHALISLYGSVTNAGDTYIRNVALEVVKTNAAPTLADTALSLGSIATNATAPANGNTTAGVLVSTLTGGITDTDAGATKGIAITGVHSGGTLYYSVDGGTTWTAAAGISATNALLLAGDANTRIMYKDTTAATLNDTITFKAWDMTQHITEGVYANTTVMGGKSEFSTASDTVAATVETASPAGQAVIDLGASGKLIAPVQVEGKWYYYWDRSGNGTNAGADSATHNVLDGIFKYDINDNLNPNAGTNTDDTYRYATLNGVKVALPTYGLNAIVTSGYNAGTAVSNNTTTENTTYDDLLAIWDSYNGATTGTDIQGTPLDWKVDIYWSATTSESGHANLHLINGYVSDGTDTTARSVALQVLPVTIDLDGDGDISYTQKLMDVNSDGKIDKTAWVDKNDGVLIWDKYHDGKVHDSSQYELSQYGGNTDLEGLAVGFDTNHDGIFDLSDERFAEFSIWQDLNNDGYSQNGEVKTLADWGINSINLLSDGIKRTDEAGVSEVGRTIATKTDGSSVVIGDAGFNYVTIEEESLDSLLKTYFELNEVVNTNSWINVNNITPPVVIYNAPVVEEEKTQASIL